MNEKAGRFPIHLFFSLMLLHDIIMNTRSIIRKGVLALISFRSYLVFEFDGQETIKNITDHVKMILEESKIQEGMILVSALHTTSAVFINDDEEGLVQDTLEFLEKIIPNSKVPYYRHNNSEKDAPAHLKRNAVGRSEMITVTEGKMDLGNWEQIFYADFNGKRKKKLCIKIIGE